MTNMRYEYLLRVSFCTKLNIKEKGLSDLLYNNRALSLKCCVNFGKRRSCVKLPKRLYNTKSAKIKVVPRWTKWSLADGMNTTFLEISGLLFYN